MIMKCELDNTDCLKLETAVAKKSLFCRRGKSTRFSMFSVGIWSQEQGIIYLKKLQNLVFSVEPARVHTILSWINFPQTNVINRRCRSMHCGWTYNNQEHGLAHRLLLSFCTFNTTGKWTKYTILHASQKTHSMLMLFVNTNGYFQYQYIKAGWKQWWNLDWEQHDTM